jgi:hypothetical protein
MGTEVLLTFLPRLTATIRRGALLTESEVSRSWNRLFKDSSFSTDTLDNAGALLDELRPESPLRHRLNNELEELRKLHASRVEA